MEKHDWIDVKTQLPEVVKNKASSKNVLAWCNGQLMIMCYAWVDEDDQRGYAWMNCYGDLTGDYAEFDDDYQPTHWMPLPEKPKPTTP